MCSVCDAAGQLGELGRARPEGHDDLLERRVAGALAEAVDGHLDLARAGLDRGQRVGRGEAEVVVAVDGDRGLAADEVHDPPDERPELGRDRVADGVGDVDRGRAGLDDRLVDLQEVVGVGARGILGGELDLGVAAQLLAAVADPADRLGEGLFAGQLELVLEVDVAGRDEDVQVGPLGDLDRLDRPLRVAVAAAGERGDGDALRLLGDPVDGLEVARRGGREAGLDDVHLEADELAGDLQLLGGGQPGAGRLLAVAQGGVEDADGARGDERAGGYGAALSGPPWAGRRRRLGLAGMHVDGVEERHRGAQLRADLLDLVVAVQRAETLELAATGLVLGDPALGEGAVLDLREDLAHRGPDVVVDDPRPGDVVAVLGGVADAEAHEVEAAAVHEVDDELELVHRLEVGELGLVAGLDERLEGHLHEGRGAAAEDALLAEEVGLGLLGERRLEDAGAGVAERPRVGEDARPGRPGGVLVDGEEGRHAAAALVDGADEVAGALRGDHPDVDTLGRGDPPEADVEPVGEQDERAGPQVRGDVRVPGGLLGRVRDGDHHDVGPGDCRAGVEHLEAGLLGKRPALRARRQPDDHPDPGLVEVLGVGVPLAPEADDRHRLAGQGRRVRVRVVVHPGRHRLVASSIDWAPRDMTTVPVRTISLIP